MQPLTTTDFQLWKSLCFFTEFLLNLLNSVFTEILQREIQKEMVESKGCLNPSRVHSKSPLCLTAYEMLWTQFPVSILKAGSSTVCLGSGRDHPDLLMLLLPPRIIIWERVAGILSDYHDLRGMASHWACLLNRSILPPCLLSTLALQILMVFFRHPQVRAEQKISINLQFLSQCSLSFS